MSNSLALWQLRVLEEREMLAQRLTKLDQFIGNRQVIEDPITPDFILLVRQQTVMKMYLDILDERIARFNHGP